MAENNTRKIGLLRFPLQIQRISWRDLAASLGPILLVSVIAFWIAFHFVRPAPPDTITIASGPEGSTLRTYAERYRDILSRNDVTVEILASEGTLDNLRKLANPDVDVDVGFVQGGLAAAVDTSELVSLGSIGYVPLAIFYRSAGTLERLSELKGRRVAIGHPASGTHFLALTLLKANGIEPHGPTKLLDIGGEEAVEALLKRRIDAAFLSGDSASPANMRKLLHAHHIRMLDFTQANAYVRRFRYLNRLELPPGSFDLGANLPPKPFTLIAPTVDLIARDDLHPALSDLLIEAAREVHGRATLIQRAGEFPAPLENEFRISDDAARYYKSGKSFAYRYLPFWLASLADRALVVLVPIIIVLIPGLRLAPALYAWRIKARIYRRYGELMALERAALEPTTPEQRTDLLKRLDDFEKAVISIKMPGSFADQLYVLRLHINFVRERLTAGTAGT
jgi:TRAP-type uncharacterized transport system substrate-binding protein